MFRKKLIIVEDDEIVAEDEGCGVRADSEYMRHHVLTQRPQATHGHREVLQQRLHTGHLEVGVGVGQEVVGQGVADPPLPMTHQRQVKIESPPLRLTVSKMKPIVTAVVGHSQEQSSNDCSCEKWIITKIHKTNEE